MTLDSPSQVIEKWVHLFNLADAQGLAELYHPEATNHQVALQPVKGREAIEDFFRAEFAAHDMTCIVENLFEDGDWAILEWKDPKGLRGAGFFQIRDGRIEFQRGYWDRLSFQQQQVT